MLSNCEKFTVSSPLSFLAIFKSNFILLPSWFFSVKSRQIETSAALRDFLSIKLVAYFSDGSLKISISLAFRFFKAISHCARFSKRALMRITDSYDLQFIKLISDVCDVFGRKIDAYLRVPIDFFNNTLSISPRVAWLRACATPLVWKLHWTFQRTFEELMLLQKMMFICNYFAYWFLTCHKNVRDRFETLRHNIFSVKYALRVKVQALLQCSCKRVPGYLNLF